MESRGTRRWRASWSVRAVPFRTIGKRDDLRRAIGVVEQGKAAHPKVHGPAVVVDGLEADRLSRQRLADEEDLAAPLDLALAVNLTHLEVVRVLRGFELARQCPG